MHAVAEARSGNSVLSLLGANLITIALALYEGWDIRELMLVYWSQSVIIGYFTHRRILDLKQFSTEDVKENGVRPKENDATKRRLAFFFVLHYGGFHLGYLIMLIPAIVDFHGSWLMLMICAIGFYVNHRYSYFHYREYDQDKKPNIGTIMLFPYARIVPMHITIICGFAFLRDSTSGLLLFLALKTAADVVMHMVEHSAWRDK